MDYLPTTDAGLLSWSDNLATELLALADPTTVGILPNDVTGYDNAQKDFSMKYSVSIRPSTEGPAATLAKNESKEALVVLSRSYAMTITNTQGVTNMQRQAFGLTVSDDEPTPVPVPTSPPTLSVDSTLGRSINLRLKDKDNPDNRGKPIGVTQAIILTFVGDDPPEDTLGWSFYETTTRTLTTLNLPSSIPSQSKLWITAFWQNGKGESGPPSPAISTIVADQVAQAKAA